MNIMPHEDFFESVLIEFVEWDKGHEQEISKFNSFDELPLNLMSYLKHKPYRVITLKGHKWKRHWIIIHYKEVSKRNICQINY